jgi:hypothetical protein
MTLLLVTYCTIVYLFEYRWAVEPPPIINR